MTRRTATADMAPLITGLAAATALAGAALFTVVGSSCNDPGQYEIRDGVVQLIGGCISREDLPVAPEEPGEIAPRPLGSAHAPDRY